MLKTKTLHPYNPILLVDDEEAWLNSLSMTLRSEGITNLSCCADSREVLALLDTQEFAAIILDVIMPHLTGEELLPEISSRFPDLPVIVTTGLDQVDIAVNCMRHGAFDYQVKGNDHKGLLSTVRKAIEISELRRENSILKDRFLNDKLEKPEIFKPIITANKVMRSLFQYMEAIAQTSEPILITGETGSGKELFAKALHNLSARPGNFVPVNVAGLDANMFTDTIFGHKKGAFTGAESSREGLLAKAAGGTIFLDEIGDLDLASQVKLLRLIQEKEYFPLGSDLAKQTDAKMIFATLHDLSSLQNKQNFRQDLFYRLRAHHIHIPPLRERPDDIPLLLDFFLQEAANKLGKKMPSYPKELPILLATYNFPGNIRELQNMIFDALSKHDQKTLSMSAFKAYIREVPLVLPGTPKDLPDSEGIFANLIQLPSLKEATNILVKEAMHRSQGNQSIAAEMLGLTRQALNWRLNNEGKKTKS